MAYHRPNLSSWPGLTRPSMHLPQVDWQNVDARDKPGHDGVVEKRSCNSLATASVDHCLMFSLRLLNPLP
jgi:hypothetical protein